MGDDNPKLQEPVLPTQDSPANCRRRSRSVSLGAAVPGIPLGTITARIASKSFWTGEMLDEALRQISHSTLKEEEPTKTSEKEEEGDVFRTVGDQLEMERGREWRSPWSSTDNCSKDNGYHTPPYLSPGVTKKLKNWSGNLQLQYLQA